MKQPTSTKKLVSVLFCILSDWVYALVPADMLHPPINCNINAVLRGCGVCTYLLFSTFKASVISMYFDKAFWFCGDLFL